ncbi:MAG TPA: DUF167 domain-containing protein [Candidatus Polarisedimenticolia bacterium]|nr:DUF167 domain-containing protein [Candidatus Polarisedimenticolia bacterium]
MDTRGLILEASGSGCRMKVRVKPGAKQDTLIGPHGGKLKMTVTAPPERGKANEAVARVLAGALNVATSRVRVVAGFASQDKVVAVDAPPEDVRRRLEAMPRVSTGR